MQFADNFFLRIAVHDDRRALVYKLEADWNRNGLYDHALSDLTSVVKEIRVDRDLLPLLPQECRIA